MAARLGDLAAFLDELLDASAFEDYGPNGIQVPGREEVRRIATGVSAHRELFERAADAGADAILTHHGLFWSSHPVALSPAMAARLRALLCDDIALLAYHLPLDAHPEVGNNALIADGLGCEGREPLGLHRGRAIGFVARFADGGIPAAELFDRVAALCDRTPLVIDAGPARVETIGIVSGSAAGDIGEAAAAGVDAFLTGEPAEHAMADAREAGLHFIAAGHYATETFGVRRLGELLAERFGIEHVFVDVPNPI